MIQLKSLSDIQIMQEGGKICSQALGLGISLIKKGVTLSYIDTQIDDFIIKHGGQASFKTVDDYKYATCINVNSGIVHGIPNDYVIQKNDLISIDLGVLYQGFHTDLSYTYQISDSEAEFLNTGKKALQKGINKAKIGNTIGDISYGMQKVVERAGYSVSEELVGHGIGRNLHEDPYVPCYGKAGRGPSLQEGMVLAIEIIYQKGDPDLHLDSDGWTLKTLDDSLSGLFEKTVAILPNETIEITNFDYVL